MNLQQTSDLVELSIKALGVDPVSTRGDVLGKWKLTNQSATIYVDVFNFPTNPNNYYLQICSPLLKVPEKNNEAFYLDLLEMNFDMYNCSICKKGDWFYVLGLRPTLGLDLSEISWILDKVAFYSNDFYPKLDFKYKGSWPPAAPVAPSSGFKAP